MDQNPYESSAAAYPLEPLSGSGRSPGIYFLATTMVIVLWSTVLVSLYFLMSPTMEDGDVWVQVSPTTMVYTSISTALTAIAILFTASIAIVNGLMFFFSASRTLCKILMRYVAFHSVK